MDQQELPKLPEAAPDDPHARVDNALTVTQLGERTICEIKRHPIGIMGIYTAAGLLLVTAAVLAFILAPHFITDSTGNGSRTAVIGGLVFLLIAIVALVFTYISTKVYWGNSWILTSDSITQISQNSLFKRQSSQLSLDDLEDVTSEQNGVFPRIFNYGLLRVETAGERSKFVFLYCPNPNYYARAILAAREAFEQGHRSEERSVNSTDAYQAATPMQPSQVDDQGYGAYQPPNGSGVSPSSDDTGSLYPEDSTRQDTSIDT